MPKLGKFEDYQAPWEVKGEDPDPEKIKRHYYNLLSDKEKLDEKVAAITTERDEYKSKLDEFETKDMSEIDRLKRENEELKNRKPEADPNTALENARLKLAIEHGLTVKQASRLSGSTAEELEADVPELLSDLGKSGNDGGDDGDQGSPFAGRYRTGNDDGKVSEDNDPDQYKDYF